MQKVLYKINQELSRFAYVKKMVKDVCSQVLYLEKSCCFPVGVLLFVLNNIDLIRLEFFGK